MLLVPTTTRLLSSLFVALTLLRRLAALLGRPGQGLRDPELNNAADQVFGQGLAEASEPILTDRRSYQRTEGAARRPWEVI